MLRTLLITLTLFAATQLGAVDIFWTWTSGNDDWNNASNWSTGTVPTANDEVFLQCNCTVDIPAGYTARARKINVDPGVTLKVRSGATIDIDSSVDNAIEIDGWVRNWGSINVDNATASVNSGILINPDGLLSNYENITVDHASHGITIYGRLRCWGDITINSSVDQDQLNGITLWNSGRLDIYSNADVVIDHTNSAGLQSGSSDVRVHLYGELIIETGTMDKGVSSGGLFYIFSSGIARIKGATSFGFINSNGGNLRNYGTLVFYNTASGTALMSSFGEIINHESGLIDISGFQYDHGIRFVGINSLFRNYGRIDVFTGMDSFDSVYFHSGTELTNYSSGEIVVQTRAQRALRFGGDRLHNRGGLIDLEVTGINKISLDIGHDADVDNTECGTIILEDGLGMQPGSVFTNEAWLECHDYGYNNPFWNGSQLVNKGVIQDFGGSVNGFLNFINNDEGVILMTPTDAIIFGQPYQDLILAGPNTDVNINDIVTADAAQNNVIGQYEGAPDYGVYFDPNAYNNPKYFHAEFEIPGCGARVYEVYNNTPTLLVNDDPVQSAAIDGGVKSVTNEVAMSVYPNPASDHLNVTLPAEVEGDVQLQLRNINGQQLFAATYRAEAGTLRLDRPANLPAGIYLLTVNSKSGAFFETRRVTFGQRN